ncbi:MAG: saccharopine dehydrogenase NADP-binding domain-containing protein [Acidobacteriota bacterium]
MKIVVLGGAGAMGRGVVRDLVTSAPGVDVVVADRNVDAAIREAGCYQPGRVEAIQADATNTSGLARILSGADVCVNCTIHDLNLAVMEACLSARCHYNDLGGLFFMTRKQVALDADFKRAGLSAVLGIGSTPGTMNVLARYAADRLDTVISANALCAFTGTSDVNGVFVPPYALQTILEEFSVPPPEFIDGEWKEVLPCSGTEEVDFFEPLGKVRCHYTLHSEPFHFATSFREKGIREATFKLGAPKQLVDEATLLVKLGFARRDKITYAGHEISPMGFLSFMVQSQIEENLRGVEVKLDVFNVLRADVAGKIAGRPVRYLVDALCTPRPDWPDIADAATSIPPSICAQMQAHGTVPAGAAGAEVMLPVDAYFRELLRRPGTTIRVTRRSGPES